MSDRYALITGATSGIGLAIARELSGYRLILASRDLARMRELQIELGPHTVILESDLSRPGSARELFERCRDYEVEVCVCNSGFGRLGEHLELPLEEVTGMAHLNMTSLVELCTLFGQPMRARRKGYLLTVASIAGFLKLPYFAEYAATKAFVVSLSVALAEELKPHGIKVSCLCPGPTATNFRTRADRPPDNRNAMTAEAVARQGLAGLFAGRAIVVPGLRNQLIASLGGLVPSRLLAWHLRRHLP